MLIKSKIERKGGTVITIDDKEYHFKPVKAEGAHVCEVKPPEHCKRLLSIKEGFAPADGEKVPDLPDEPTKEEEVLNNPDGINAALDGLESEDEDDDDPSEGDPEEVDENWYRAQYEELFGKKPHHNTKLETIKADVDKILTPNDED